MYIGDLLPQVEHWWYLPTPHHHLQGTDERSRRLVFVNDDMALPRVVMFHDSFAPYFDTQWAETCSRFTMSWGYDFDLGLVRAERPDLVVEFIVERALVFQDPAEITPGERGPETRFAAAKRVLYELDVEHPALRPVFRGVCRSERDESGSYVRLIVAGPLDSFWLDGLSISAGANLLVRVDLDVEQAGDVALHWKTSADPGWSVDRRVTAQVQAGRNTVYLEVPALPGTMEGLVLRPLEHVGQCCLRGLEVRVATAAK